MSLLFFLRLFEAQKLLQPPNANVQILPPEETSQSEPAQEGGPI